MSDEDEPQFDLFSNRSIIDACDEGIAALLARRSVAVASIRRERIRLHQDTRDPIREAAVTAGVFARMKAHCGRYDSDTITRIYAAIFDGCESLQAAVPCPVHGGDRGSPRY